jgi:hypothetical protein
MSDADRPLRPWREIALELFEQSNTAKMHSLLNELTEAFKQQRAEALEEKSKRS